MSGVFGLPRTDTRGDAPAEPRVTRDAFLDDGLPDDLRLLAGLCVPTASVVLSMAIRAAASRTSANARARSASVLALRAPPLALRAPPSPTAMVPISTSSSAKATLNVS